MQVKCIPTLGSQTSMTVDNLRLTPSFHKQGAAMCPREQAETYVGPPTPSLIPFSQASHNGLGDNW